MSRSFVTIITGLALIAGVTVAGLAYAHGYRMGPHHARVHYEPGMYAPGMEYGFPHGMPGPGWRDDGEHRLMHFAGHLDLSDEQRDAIREIFDRMRSRQRELGDALRDNRRAMTDAMHNKGYGTDFERMADRHGGLVADMIKLRAETHASIREVLTKEQRARLPFDHDYGDFYDRH